LRDAGGGLDASQLTTGALDDARLSINVLKLNSVATTSAFRFGGLIEQGTALPLDLRGVLTRHALTNINTAGTVIAKTPAAQLERDGTNGGMRVSYSATPGGALSILAMGIDSAGAAVNKVLSVPDTTVAGSIVVYTDAENIVFFSLQFGDPTGNHITDVRLSRVAAGASWNGFLTSTTIH
jgi:hypothetical protein